MDGFEDFYVILFSMNSDFSEKEHCMYFKILNLQYIFLLYIDIGLK